MLATHNAPPCSITQHLPPTMLLLPCRVPALLRHSARFKNLYNTISYPQLVACASTGSHQSIQTSAVTSDPTQQQHQQEELQQQWYQQSSVYYSNYPLNRAAEQRRDEVQLSHWFNAADTRVTPVMGSKVLLSSSSNSSSSNSSNNNNEQPPTAKYQPVWFSPASDLGAVLDPAVPPLFLGLHPSTGTAHFAVQVTADSAQQLAAAAAAAAAQNNNNSSSNNGGDGAESGGVKCMWVSARTAGPDLALGDAALLAVASGLAQWNLDSQYHGSSGGKTLPQDGGFSRRCSSSGRSVYPRIDPAIITLVTAGPDWCLLGRKGGWPTGRYSTLAGFLELGETLEQALCREVLEESGVVTDLNSVRYVASQPWPFPRSLMVGFYAEAAATAGGAAAGGANSGSSVSSSVEWLSHQGRMAMMDTRLTPDEVADAVQGLRLQVPKPQEDEMEDVRFFHREWLQWALQQGEAATPGGFFIPGNYSLAYRLITGWLGTTTTATTTDNSSSSTSTTGNNGTSASNSSSSSSSWLGDQVPQVEIDQGVFKYVLLRLTDRQDSSRSKLLVRGSSAAAYHNHILQHTKGQLPAGSPLDVQVVGGGRIEHYPEQQVIRVYGYSAAFGPAVHEVTAGLLKKWHPFHSSITWSYEGY